MISLYFQLSYEVEVFEKFNKVACDMFRPIDRACYLAFKATVIGPLVEDKLIKPLAYSTAEWINRKLDKGKSNEMKIK